MLTVPGKFLLQIFEKSAPCLLMKADAPVFTLVLANEAYLKFTGLKRADIAGKSAFTIFPDRSKGAITTLKAMNTKQRVVIRPTLITLHIRLQSVWRNS
jgi:hypothetical protein